MGLRQFFGQLQHVVMLPADDPVTSHFRRIGRREAHRNGVVVHVQADEQDRAFGDCTSGRPSRAAVVTGAAGFGRGKRIDFCGSTGLQLRSMYVFMVSVFLSMFQLFMGSIGVPQLQCGSAPFTRCNPRLPRRADTLFAFITSHTV
jgi:hypothetical protein